MRLLVWLGLALIVYLALRSKMRSMQQNFRDTVNAEFAANASGPVQNKASVAPENMVACVHCHLYLPASEAFQPENSASGQFFCCEEHLKSHLNAAPSSNSQTPE